ncbi:MAG: NlpC/P60 family protein [Aestuariivirga sp.]
MTETLDPRVNAFRSDLADERLQGHVEAKSFVAPKPMRVAAPIAPILKSPKLDAVQTSQALLGEDCMVFETANGFCWVQLKKDGYVGYVEQAHLTADISDQTHRVKALSTLAYPKPDLRSRPAQLLPLNAKVAVVATSDEFAELSSGLFVYKIHLAPIGEWEEDFVGIAQMFLQTPYLWGGKTNHGIDCSGLVQISLEACGISSPRDSDMQEKQLGHLANDKDYRRGDLVFWPGHVGIMIDSKFLLHANGHSMNTVIEPLIDAVQRSEVLGKPVTSIKRL